RDAPQLRRRVLAGGGQVGAVGAERDAEDEVLVVGEGGDRRAGDGGARGGRRGRGGGGGVGGGRGGRGAGGLRVLAADHQRHDAAADRRAEQADDAGDEDR